jgi:hypothetical protein
MAEPRGIFISYCSEDRSRVRRLRRDLLSSGLRVWWDGDLESGDNWNDRILAEVRKSAAVVACWSQASAARERSGQWAELNEAFKEAQWYPPSRPFIFPVRMEECERSADLGQFEDLDLFPEHEWPTRIAMLVERLHRVLSPSVALSRPIFAAAGRVEFAGRVADHDDWVRLELEAARAAGKPILPVVLSAAEAAFQHLPASLAWSWVRMAFLDELSRRSLRMVFMDAQRKQTTIEVERASCEAAEKRIDAWSRRCESSVTRRCANDCTRARPRGRLPQHGS